MLNYQNGLIIILITYIIIREIRIHRYVKLVLKTIAELKKDLHIE